MKKQEPFLTGRVISLADKHPEFWVFIYGAFENYPKQLSEPRTKGDLIDGWFYRQANEKLSRFFGERGSNFAKVFKPTFLKAVDLVQDGEAFAFYRFSEALGRLDMESTELKSSVISTIINNQAINRPTKDAFISLFMGKVKTSCESCEEWANEFMAKNDIGGEAEEKGRSLIEKGRTIEPFAHIGIAGQSLLIMPLSLPFQTRIAVLSMMSTAPFGARCVFEERLRGEPGPGDKESYIF